VKVAVLVLTALFWLSFVAVAGWLTVYAVDHAFIVGRLGERGSRLGFTLLLGALALASGLLVAYHRLTNMFIDRDAYRPGAEVGYALALFVSLFFGLYSARLSSVYPTLPRSSLPAWLVYHSECTYPKREGFAAVALADKSAYPSSNQATPYGTVRPAQK
jgi:hypothetical protein